MLQCSRVSVVSLFTIGLIALVAATSMAAFSFNSETGTITSYSGDDRHVIIPDTIDGVVVVAIGDEALMGKGMVGMTIPESVTSIGDYAFAYSVSLDMVVIPEGVTHLGTGAFYSCSSLTSVVLPDRLTSISDRLFEYCERLAEVSINDGIARIGNKSFSGCESLVSIVVPDGVTSIGDYAFAECTILTDITLPASVTSIGEGAFAGSFSLTIHAPEGSAAHLYADQFRIPYNPVVLAPPKVEPGGEAPERIGRLSHRAFGFAGITRLSSTAPDMTDQILDSAGGAESHMPLPMGEDGSHRGRGSTR